MTRNDFLRIVEIRTKIVSVSSFLIGTVFAAVSGAGFSWSLALVMFAAVLCVDMGTTGFNSYYDFVNGVDRPDTDIEGDKILLRGDTRPAAALAISGGFFLAAAGLGLVIGLMAGWQIIVVGTVCMAAGFFYSGGPYPLSRTPFGELLAGGFLGWVLIALSFVVQTGRLTPAAVWLGLPSTALIASILTVNNTCDLVGDRRAGRYTLSIALGARRSEWVIYGLGALAYGLAFALIGSGILTLPAVIPLALAALVSASEYRRMHGRGFSPATKAASMASISKVFVAFTAALLIALSISA
ncbi:MAG: prenyltransferase [Gammaproteobacteria bacterium]|jgi:1,4-dihydroxy-2-naphthoate octaprenyltransferase